MRLPTIRIRSSGIDNVFLGYAYLALYALYSFVYVLNSSLLKLGTIYNATRMICCVGVVAVIALTMLTKKYTLKALITLVLVVVLSLIVAITTGQHTKLLIMCLLILGATTVDFKSIVRVAFVATTLSILIILFCTFVGIIPNYYYTGGDRAAWCLGFAYYSNFPVIVMYMLFMYLYLRGEKIKWVELAIALVISLVVFTLSTKRVTFYASVIVLIADVFLFKLYKRPIGRNRVIAIIVSIVFPIGVGITAGISYLYVNYQSDWLDELNHIVAGRISLVARAFDMYPLTLFGQPVEMQGNSAEEVVHNYFYIDSGFMYALIAYGIVFLVLILFMYSYLFHWAYRRSEKVLFIWIIGVLAYSFINDTWLNVAYNPLILSFGCVFLKGSPMRLEEFERSMYGKETWHKAELRVSDDL